MPSLSIPGYGTVIKFRGSWQGTVASVTYAPVTEEPRFTARLVGLGGSALTDGTTEEPRSLSLVWLGRRRVGGVVPGSVVRVDGLVAIRGGFATMINPRFEVIAAPVTD